MTFARRFILCITLIAGCGDVSPAQSDVDSLYPQGMNRRALNLKDNKMIWLDERDPVDVFATATIRQLLSMGRPRPSSYETFMMPRMNSQKHQGGWYMDYIFYDSQSRIIYAARKTME